MVGFSSYSHSFSRSILTSTVLLLVPPLLALHCHQHSPIDKNVSPFMNTCVTTRFGYCVYKELGGRVERNCDGNGVQQISVCKELMEKKETVISRESLIDHRRLPSEGRKGGCLSSSGYPCTPDSLRRVSPTRSANDPRDEYTKVTRDGPPSSYPFTPTHRARSSKACFDLGQLGRFCCCQGDKCNSASSLSLSILLLLPLILLM
ncbi:hypothetical protein PMAYCL1PPCAC_29259 [Pristionchus mayeri]|uniref:Uncharacterized protein n=1 Tax=Pristionchus mayeri TaxID=1317129 RepID=A0AAN5DBW5_9BILA|nr:hypothetical protein PMAYCL1PPCAC_29259 [Pristionchus mayeri]